MQWSYSCLCECVFAAVSDLKYVFIRCILFLNWIFVTRWGAGVPAFWKKNLSCSCSKTSIAAASFVFIIYILHIYLGHFCLSTMGCLALLYREWDTTVFQSRDLQVRQNRRIYTNYKLRAICGQKTFCCFFPLPISILFQADSKEILLNVTHKHGIIYASLFPTDIFESNTKRLLCSDVYNCGW